MLSDGPRNFRITDLISKKMLISTEDFNDGYGNQGVNIIPMRRSFFQVNIVMIRNYF